MQSNSVFGKSQLWGHSPNIDILSVLGTKTKNSGRNESLNESKDNDDIASTVNALLIGSCDVRHLLTSLCHSRRYDTKLNIYFWEDSVIGMARTILFIAIALDFDTIIEQRTQFLLELYGNTLLRHKTTKYLQTIAKILVYFITETKPKSDDNNNNNKNNSNKILCKLNQLFDLTQIKYKERDELECVFKFWMKFDFTKNTNNLNNENDENNSSINNNKFENVNIIEMRENRLRKYYGERYDYRLNLIDWDYTWNIYGQASIIHKKHYTYFRQTGIAFPIRDYIYDKPNITLLSYIKASKIINTKSQTHDPCLLQGYWSDIVNSPYFTFGIKSTNKQLFKISSQQHVKTSVDVSEYNIKSLLLELQFGQRVNDDEIKVPIPNNSEKEADCENSTQHKKEINQQNEPIKQEKSCEIDTNNVNNSVTNGEIAECKIDDNVKFTIMPMDLVKLLSKSKFNNKFNCILVGTFYVHMVNNILLKTLYHNNSNITNNSQNESNNNSLIMIESPKYLVELKGNEKKTYIDKIKARMENLKMKCILQPDSALLQIDPPKGGLSIDTYKIDNQNNLDAYLLFQII